MRKSNRPPGTTLALCGASALVLAFQIWVIAQWSAAFSAGGTQAERVAYFHAELPAGLGNLSTSGFTWLCAGLGIGAVVAAVVASRRSSGGLRALSVVLAGVNGMLVLWYLFTMM